jgi:thiamine pyrophosphokinase
MHALIFANGRSNDGPMARQVLAQAVDPLLIAADGGVDVAEEDGIEVGVFIGDMDSVDPAALAQRERAGATVLRYSAEKDATDLELALLWAVEQGADWIRVLGAMGGRLDQTLANIYLLALPELHDCDARLVSDHQQAWLLYPGEHRIQGHAGDTLSLIPLAGPAAGIHTEHLYYPLRDETLRLGPARGISNVMQGDEALVRFESGLLLVVHSLGEAE